MHNPISRRGFLIGLVTALGAAAVSCGRQILGQAEARPAATFGVDLPLVTKGAPGNLATSTPTLTETPPAATWTPTSGTSPKVIHVHSSSATNWNYSTGWYGSYVSQSTVNSMVDEGVKRLTGQSTVAAAWQTLLPGYSPGKGIAIKVNFNNAQCTDTDNLIDALIHPVNALIAGMKQIGVREQDVWIYDASRPIPSRFRSGCPYTGVQYFDKGCAHLSTWTSTDPNASVIFANPSLTPRRVSDVIINASYLINMPIMKDHDIAGVTLGFKNHFGTIDQIVIGGWGSSNDPHEYIRPGGARYSSSYSPFVDIYKNSHIRNKTALVVGDGLYGAYGSGSNTATPPKMWQSFKTRYPSSNGAPNSLFFSKDPVAIDCVMMDILYAEPTYHPYQGSGSDDYLKVARDAGLGVFEHGSPWGAGYTKINYQRVEL